MSAEILDLIVAQIEERRGQDYAEAVLPPHQVCSHCPPGIARGAAVCDRTSASDCNKTTSAAGLKPEHVLDV